MSNRRSDRPSLWPGLIGLTAILVLAVVIIVVLRAGPTTPNVPPVSGPLQAGVTPTPTLTVPEVKATVEQSVVEAETVVALTPTAPLVTPTPDTRPTQTPDYGNIPHRVAGAGIIFDEPPSQPPAWRFLIRNTWSETDGPNIGVYAGSVGAGAPPVQGAIRVVQNDDLNNPQQYLMPFQDGPMRIVDAQGTQLMLMSEFHHMIAFFDVGTGQVTTPTSSSIASNFNGTAIAASNYIWFNSILKVNGLGSRSTTLWFVGSNIQFTANGTNYNLSVPNGLITFSPTATQATTTFNADSNRWETIVPLTYTGNVFLTGLAYQVSSAGLPGGINPVTWSGQFASDTPGATIGWKWAAAVYTQFSPNSDGLGVKPVDGDKVNAYHNSDHAGTPENFKPFVIGGARGGGGSNYTGSYSGTGHVTP